MEQLRDMLAIGPKKGQRGSNRPARVIPGLSPRLLRFGPIPFQAKDARLITQSSLDTGLPQIIPIDDMMYNLPNRPRLF